ncbi:MAG: MotE family protein [Alphaproteobacteria bacterium]
MAFGFKFRILPAALIGAGVLLAGKAGALWFEFDSPASAATSEQAAALDSAAPPAPAPEDAVKNGTSEGAVENDSPEGVVKNDASEGTVQNGTPANAGEAGRDAADGDEAAADDHGSTGARLGLDDKDFDPMMLTRAEIELLQGLSERRAALEERERAFALREQTLAAAKLQLDAKIKALEALKQTVEGLLQQQEKEAEERLKSLVKIYESMKPKDAAPILNGLDLPTVLDLIERMKEAKSAPILALLPPSRAKTITEQLIARHRLPETETAATPEPEPEPEQSASD